MRLTKRLEALELAAFGPEAPEKVEIRLVIINPGCIAGARRYDDNGKLMAVSEQELGQIKRGARCELIAAEPKRLRRRRALQ